MLFYLDKFRQVQFNNLTGALKWGSLNAQHDMKHVQYHIHTLHMTTYQEVTRAKDIDFSHTGHHYKHSSLLHVTLPTINIHIFYWLTETVTTRPRIRDVVGRC
jgi:hypothetical protein